MDSGGLLTLPSQEIQCGPQLATLLAPAPSFELQRTAFAADTELVGTKQGKPWVAPLDGTNQNVRALVRRTQKHNNGEFVVIQSPGTLSVLGLGL